MREWQVFLDLDYALMSDRLGDLLTGPLAPYHTCGSGGDGYNTSGFVLTVEAATSFDALAVAWRAVTSHETMSCAVAREFTVRPMPGDDETPLSPR